MEWKLVGGTWFLAEESVWRLGRGNKCGMLEKQQQAGGSDSGWRERLVSLAGPPGPRGESGFDS